MPSSSNSDFKDEPIVFSKVDSTSLVTSHTIPWYDFTNRSDGDKAHAITRAYVEHLPLENASELASDPEQAFFLDLDRVKHSHYFARLQDVNQFLPGGTHGLQTRGSHTDHVQMVSHKICRALKLSRQSEDLAVAIASIHDIGHPPFAHDGEDAFRERMQKFGGNWDHDMMGLRVITEMANMGMTYPGMNLSLDVIEGLAKRYWRYTDDEKQKGHFLHLLKDVPESVHEIDKRFNLHLKDHNHIEGQIAAAADWIAFTATDIEDALKSGMMKFDDLAAACPVAKEVYDTLMEQIKQGAISGISLKLEAGNYSSSLINTFARALEDRLTSDVIVYANEALHKAKKSGKVKHAEDIRNLDELVISFSPKVLASLKTFNTYCDTCLWPDTRKRYAISPAKMVGILFDDLFRGYVNANQGGVKRRIDIIGNDDTQWEKKYRDLKALPESQERDKALGQLICEYITIFYTDRKVVRYMERFHKDLYEKYGMRGAEENDRFPAYFAENLGTFTASESTRDSSTKVRTK